MERQWETNVAKVVFITKNTVYSCILKMSIAWIKKMKLYYICETRISKLVLYSEMSILAGKPEFSSWEGYICLAGWEIQNKVTKQPVNFLKFWWDMSMFQVLTSIISLWLNNASLNAPKYRANIMSSRVTFLGKSTKPDLTSASFKFPFTNAVSTYAMQFKGQTRPTRLNENS